MLKPLDSADYAEYEGSPETGPVQESEGGEQAIHSPAQHLSQGDFDWSTVPQQYPASTLKSLPSGEPNTIPRIQHEFEEEDSLARKVRLRRLDAVMGNFTHAWSGYKSKAWLHDEVKPLSGEPRDAFGGWAATLVDSLGAYPPTLTNRGSR